MNPNKSNRRYFIARCLNPLIRQGVIEKVKVPGKNSRVVICIRLAEEGKMDGQPGHAVQDLDEDTESKQRTGKTSQYSYFLVRGDGDEGLAMNLTLHKQIVDLLVESGEKGMTLNVGSTQVIYALSFNCCIGPLHGAREF